MAVHRGRPPCLGEEGADVFDLALDRVRGGVAAVAPAPTIVVEHGEMLRQLFGGRVHQSPVAHRPAHQYDRRTVAEPVEGDYGAVPRSYLGHGLSFLPRSSGPFLVDHRSSQMPQNGLRSGRPVGKVDDARRERLGVHELQRLVLTKVLEEALAPAHHHGVDHELELVEESVLQQRTDEGAASGDHDVPAIPLLEPTYLLANVLADERGVLPAEWLL